MKKCTLLITLIVVLTNMVNAQADTVGRKLITGFVSFGYISGNDYGYALKNYTQEENDGGYLGLLSLDLGINVNLTNNFSICAGVNTISDLSIILATSDNADESANATGNFIFLPGVSAKYYFFNKGLTSLFVSPGISATICTSGLSDFIYKSNGLEKEFFLGYEHTYGFYTKKSKLIRRACFGLKLGYISIPVNVQDSNTNVFHQKDFGGSAFSIYSDF